MSKLDNDKLAKRFGVSRGAAPSEFDHAKFASNFGAQPSKVSEARGGYFGALQLAAEVSSRFRTPPKGGRASDPNWTERRLIPLTEDTLHRLEELAAQLKEQGVQLEVMQLAALLLEKAALRTAEETKLDLSTK